ncbi:FRG domain-containing protein [Collimonas sp. PA-H2]|uniref:FRG domain-containing protein n=1 Tax=Collimonas sp. PA-H2 TaxID=1881062 RepID=UPI000BF531F0|nr:FRG domain-containing protein [Collimonas sp. PA-H2]PFH08806.1 FRG domain-containing protein [Collimonas sp. PA-H2]
MRTTTKAITGLSSFFEVLERFKTVDGRVDLYRGHTDKLYTLQPSLFRTLKHRKDEKNIFRELISLHPSEFEGDGNVFEKLVRMQHYSLPTRLLDLTYNPLVALFFACNSRPTKDGEFIRFSIKKAKIRYFDSDTVSCVANLSNLTGNERDKLRRIKDFDQLQNSDAGKRLLQFIKAEKPYFLPQIDPADLQSILAVKPKQSNRRILAQQGAFLLFGLPILLNQKNDLDIEISRVPIASNHKRAILDQLDKININASTLFPEIESAAKYIMSKLSPLERGAGD